MVALLLRPKGATRPEIAKAIDWTSMRRSTLGRMVAGKVKLREDKDGRFFGTALA